MNEKKKSKYRAILAALLVHAGAIALLFFLSFTLPEKEEESGVTVMMGNTQNAYGGFAPSSLVDVKVMEKPAEVKAQPKPKPAAEQELITQTEEETVAIKPKVEPRKETKKVEKTEAEKAEEARKLAEAKAERERKAAAEAAAKKVAGAFGKGAEMGDSGETTGKGTAGSPTGNASSGVTTGSPGYGTFDLGGRSLGEGGLPKPVYNVQDEGRVVVTITVNPGGYVIATGINRLTNTVNPVLRKAAEDAAKKARFNAVEGVNNQTGTITYYFNLK